MDQFRGCQPDIYLYYFVTVVDGEAIFLRKTRQGFQILFHDDTKPLWAHVSAGRYGLIWSVCPQLKGATSVTTTNTHSHTIDCVLRWKAPK